MNIKTQLIFIILLIVLLVQAFCFPTLLTISDLVGSDYEQNSIILWQLRLPRLVLCCLVGGILAVAGVIFQTIFRNPLASPYSLGVSAGSACGAGIAILLQNYIPVEKIYLVNISSMLGAGLTALFVLAVSQLNKFSTNAVILSGVILNLFFSSLILFIQYISDYTQLMQVTRWLMGSVGVVGWESVLWLILATIIIMFLIFRRVNELDILGFGDELSFAHGVSAVDSKRYFVILVTILIAFVVTLCGPIGFVGIIIPHFVKLLGFRLHLSQIIVSFFVGAVFLASCDTFAKSIIFPFEIPVGVITALVGSPIFFWLLVRNKGY